MGIKTKIPINPKRILERKTKIHRLPKRVPERRCEKFFNENSQPSKMKQLKKLKRLKRLKQLKLQLGMKQSHNRSLPRRVLEMARLQAIRLKIHSIPNWLNFLVPT